MRKIVFLLLVVLLMLPVYAFSESTGGEQSFVAMNGEWEVHGTIRFPVDYAEGQTYPVAILSHGIMDDRNQSGLFITLADVLDDMGIVSVRFDFSGYGESAMPLTLNSFITEKEDLEAVVSYVKEQSFADTSMINLVGYSMGGAVSSLVAGELQEEINSICLWSPAANLVDNAKKGVLIGDPIDINNIPDEIPAFGKYVYGRAYFEDVLDLEIYDIAQKYSGPVLILQGDQDNIVPKETSIRYDEVYENSELVMIEGAGHMYRGDVLTMAINQTTDFLVKNITQ